VSSSGGGGSSTVNPNPKSHTARLQRSEASLRKAVEMVRSTDLEALAKTRKPHVYVLFVCEAAMRLLGERATDWTAARKAMQDSEGFLRRVRVGACDGLSRSCHATFTPTDCCPILQRCPFPTKLLAPVGCSMWMLLGFSVWMLLGWASPFGCCLASPFGCCWVVAMGGGAVGRLYSQNEWWY
jgi:hypothetical protein